MVVPGPLASTSSPPRTPTTMAFDRADATISELAASLSTVTRRVASGTSSHGQLEEGGSWEDERKALEREVVMVAQIGEALLERQEAYRIKTDKELDGLRKHKEQANSLLMEANDQLQTVRQTNENLVSQLASSTRENAGLERRLLQSLTSLTLSDSSIATLRGEITSLRGTVSKQAGAQARSTGWEDKVRVTEKARDEYKEELSAERKRRVDLERKVHKAQERISELEVKLNAARREFETASKTKEEMVQDVALQVKTCMDSMHGELHSGGSPNPEVQQVLEGLMAENVTLKSDNTELRDLLNEYRQTEVSSPHTAHYDQSVGYSVYSEGEDGGGGGNYSRSSTAFFSDELAASTSSRPAFDRAFSSEGARQRHGRQDSWAPSFRSSFANRHHRNDSFTPSLAPSYASSSSFGGGPGSADLLSPQLHDEELDSAGLGLGSSGFPPGGKKGVYSLSGSARRFKGKAASSSSSAAPTAWQRGHVKRSYSLDRPRGVQRAFSQGVGSIAERSATDDEATASAADTPDVDGAFSPSSLDADPTFGAFDPARRASVPSGSNSHRPTQLSSAPLTMSDLETSQISPEKRKVRRRPMLLLSKSKAVQTEPVDFGTSTDSDLFSPVSDSFINPHLHRNRPSISPSISTTTSDLEPRPALSHTDSLTSSPTLPPYTSAGGLSSESGPGTVDPRSLALHSLIEYMSRLLLKISQSDVQTLTKRLKRQHLPGDVGHLSKSTLNSIISEVNELRNHFRTVLETERKQDLLAQSAGEKERQFESQVTRKDFLALVKLFKDIFTELSSLRLSVNEVVLDPSSASKLRERVLADEDQEATRPPLKTARNSSGLGWISAPISKFFITPPVENSEDDSSAAGSGRRSSHRGDAADRGRLHPSRAAPKLAAATASTATTVNVEFASGGAVRRATATTSLGTSDSSDTSALRPSPSTSGLQPPSESTVRAASPTRPSASRANLRGIFAGASTSSSASTGSWLVVAGQGGAPPGRLRHAASSSGLRSTVAANNSGLGTRSTVGSPTKRLSSAVDAVLDPSTSSAGGPTFERKLRKTASDESIRSHYLEPTSSDPSCVAGLGIGAPPARKIPARTTSGGMFANLSSRLLAFAGDSTGILGGDSLDPSAGFAAASPPGSSSLTPSPLARPSFLSSVGSGWDDGRNDRL